MDKSVLQNLVSAEHGFPAHSPLGRLFSAQVARDPGCSGNPGARSVRRCAWCGAGRGRAGRSGARSESVECARGGSPRWFTQGPRVLPVREANATPEGRKQASRGAPKFQARGFPGQPHPVPAPEKPPKFVAPWTLFPNLGPSSPTS